MAEGGVMLFRTTFHSVCWLIRMFTSAHASLRLKSNVSSASLVCSPVMEVPTDEPLSEERARSYFRDVILGIEYRKYLTSLDTL